MTGTWCPKRRFRLLSGWARSRRQDGRMPTDALASSTIVALALLERGS
jgi:hypothetical protein